MQLIIGIIFGILLCTVGAGSIAKWIDKGVEQTQTIIKDNVK
jgi:hypothetical protein